MDFLETVKFIKKAHGTQTDKAGIPYWKHPYRVSAYYLELFPDATLEELQAALLHDVIEDANMNEKELLSCGFDANVIQTVSILSRERPRVRTYRQYIQDIIDSRNVTALRVKLADLHDNMDPVRIAQLKIEERSIIRRYSMAYEMVIDSLYGGK